MGSSNDNLAGPGTEGDRGVVTLVQGGVHLTIYSSSLFVALRIVIPGQRHKAGGSRALLAYVPTSTTKETLGGFVTWGDVADAPEDYVGAPYWDLGHAMKTFASYATLVVLHEVFASVVRSILAQHDAGNGAIVGSHCPPLSTVDQETVHIPRIIVTPPDDDSSSSLNAIPTPQNAAFGNQLTVPDPESKVINRSITEDPFSDGFRAEDSPPDSSTRTDGEADAGDTEVCDGITTCASLDDEDNEDVTALGLGPTWSG